MPMKLHFLTFCSDLTAPIHSLTIVPMWNALDVQWDHDFHLCRSFIIYLNDTAVPGCTNVTALSCTIRNLVAGAQYVVRVVAMESDIEPIDISQTAATLEANAGM